MIGEKALFTNQNSFQVIIELTFRVLAYCIDYKRCVDANILNNDYLTADLGCLFVYKHGNGFDRSYQCVFLAVAIIQQLSLGIASTADLRS